MPIIGSTLRADKQEVLEHIEDQAAFVDIAASALTSGGFLVLTTPNATVQRARTAAELEQWGLQPIENWVTKKDLRRLLAPRFDIIKVCTIIPGFGSKGIFRLANSSTLRRVLDMLGLLRMYEALLLQVGCGLHLCVLARRRV